MRIDLHMHTDMSDGVLSPEDVVTGAVEGRLDVIAVTDHDTAAGVERARGAAAEHEIVVVSGVELSSTHEGREVHVLAYGVDVESEAIRAHQVSAGRRRMVRMEEMVSRLNGAGVGVELDDVKRAAGPGTTMIGRPHLAQALVTLGHATSVAGAFDTLIGDTHPAFIPSSLGTPLEVIEVALAAGGIPVWAHPSMDLLEERLPVFVEAGLRGLEAYRPGWPKRRIRRVVALAEAAGIMVTGGSDWHGPQRNGRIGDFWVSGGLVRPFLEALEIEVM